MYADGVRVFLEVGPRGNLTGFVDDILAGRDYAAIPCNLTSRSGLLQLHHALGQLCAHGVAMIQAPLYARRQPNLLPLTNGDPPTPDSQQRRPTVKLKMDIPLVSLDASDRARIRNSLITVLGGHTSSPQATPDQSLSSLPASETRPNESPLMHAHIQAMEKILSAHEEILRNLLARR